MDSLALDQLIGTFVSIEDAAEEVGKICNAYKREDIDLTIALTHIGIESDIQLAKLLKPEWGVDLIIGGHSHSVLEQPLKVNDILIAQAGYGTDQIGRFDIEVDDATNSISEWKWELVPINSQSAESDESLEAFIHGYKTEIDKKYNGVVTRFTEKLLHPVREEETTLGNLIADALAEVSETQIMLIGSGSIRSQELGPVVTLGSLKECFPFEDSLVKYQIKGKLLKKMFTHIMRTDNRNGEGECFQINKRVQAVYSDKEEQLVSLAVDGKDVLDEGKYTITLQNYHVVNSEANLGLTNAELIAGGNPKVVSTSTRPVLEEWLRVNPNARAKIEGRIVYKS